MTDTAATLVAALEQDGLLLRIEGEKLKLNAPADKLPYSDVLARLRENRTAVLEYLRAREQPKETQFSSFPDPIVQKTEKLESWLRESRDTEPRFGQPHARLFPFIGQKVRTPGGPGTLLQVFADRVTVALDSELSRCSFYAPAEIEPVHSEG